MPINATCGECGTSYKVKDEAAGKSIRCKSCGTAFKVPSGKSSGGSKKAKPADAEDDFFAGLNAAAAAEKSSRAADEEDEFADDEVDERPAPRARKPAASGRGSRAASSRPAKRASSEGGGGGGVLKIIGAILGGLFGFGVAFRAVTALMGGGLVNWQTFTPPDAAFTVEMPGRAVSKPAAAGQQLWGAQTSRFACAVVWGALPADAAAIATTQPDLFYQSIADGARSARPNATIQSNQPGTLGGIAGREITISVGRETAVMRFCIHSGVLYGTEFTYRGSTPPNEINRFHNSFRFAGVGAPAGAVPPTGMPPGAPPTGTPAAAPGAPSAAASVPYLERRKTFQTRLVKRGKAPQEFEVEPNPPNVTQVNYPSGSLNLKAWVYKPPAGGPKFPALVFFHGGFAFGVDDLMACKPFMDAGFVVMAPSLRGENGNPGEFELFGGELDDGRAACKWLASQPYVDAAKIYTFGHSVGGGISAMLSLFDDVPIRHGGSSGGLYNEATFSEWRDITPFDTTNPAEKQMRVLVGNIASMQRPHYAYLGGTDFAFHPAEGRARVEGGASSKLTIERIPGDHFTSFDPALRRYLEIVRANP